MIEKNNFLLVPCLGPEKVSDIDLEMVQNRGELGEGMVGIGEERGKMLQAEPSDHKLNHGLNLI